MDYLFTTEALISLFTLSIMEIVLGVDNIVFISIVSSKLPQEQQKRARNLGLLFAMIPRVLLLLAISWIIQLKNDLIDISILGARIEMTGKGLVLLIGGLFLLYSSTKEIHHKLEGAGDEHSSGKKGKKVTFSSAIMQIVLLNIVFSFDSVMTAVGLAKHVEIMIIAVVISSLVMMVFAGKIANFVNKHPTVKMLALAFLLMIGMLLVVEAVEINGEPIEVPKGYVYFAMGFSLFVEMLNLRMQKKNSPVQLKNRFEDS